MSEFLLETPPRSEVNLPRASTPDAPKTPEQPGIERSLQPILALTGPDGQLYIQYQWIEGGKTTGPGGDPQLYILPLDILKRMIGNGVNVVLEEGSTKNDSTPSDSYERFQLFLKRQEELARQRELDLLAASVPVPTSEVTAEAAGSQIGVTQATPDIRKAPENTEARIVIPENFLRINNRKYVLCRLFEDGEMAKEMEQGEIVYIFPLEKFKKLLGSGDLSLRESYYSDITPLNPQDALQLFTKMENRMNPEKREVSTIVPMVKVGDQNVAIGAGDVLYIYHEVAVETTLNFYLRKVVVGGFNDDKLITYWSTPKEDEYLVKIIRPQELTSGGKIISFVNREDGDLLAEDRRAGRKFVEQIMKPEYIFKIQGELYQVKSVNSKTKQVTCYPLTGSQGKQVVKKLEPKEFGFDYIISLIESNQIERLLYY